MCIELFSSDKDIVIMETVNQLNDYQYLFIIWANCLKYASGGDKNKKKKKEKKMKNCFCLTGHCIFRLDT